EVIFATDLGGPHHAQIAAAEPDRRLPNAADRRGQLLVDVAAEDHQRHIARLRVRDTQSVDERRLVAEALHCAREHHPAAVDDDDLVPLGTEFHYSARETLHEFLVLERCATNFYD